MKSGIDNISKLGILKGKKLGLVTNPTGVNSKLVSTAQVLKDNFRLEAVYGPEHGIRGDYQAGVQAIAEEIDPVLKVRNYSLFGKTRIPTPDMLEGIDMMVYDIQDVGARFYTYIYTLSYVMEECAKADIPVTVLDRPNPIGGTQCEGLLLDEKLSSFVGRFAIPTRYAMTVGEFARYFNAVYHVGCQLNVVPCSGWKRCMHYEQTRLPWVMPSPNIPTPECAFIYIGTCIFEGTDVSEGRGTTHPFELIGAPNLDAPKLVQELNKHKLPGILWRPVHFTPTFSKHAGELCHGVQLHITSRDLFRPFESGLWLFHHIREQYPELKCTEGLDRLLGSTSLREGTADVPEIIRIARKDSKAFQLFSKEFHIYK